MMLRYLVAASIVDQQHFHRSRLVGVPQHGRQAVFRLNDERFKRPKRVFSIWVRHSDE
jgi:hypothetical protein